MPRKTNGFGSSKSLSFKGAEGGNNRIDKGMGVKAAGVYPSNRRIGS